MRADKVLMKKWEEAIIQRGFVPIERLNLQQIDDRAKIGFVDSDGYMYAISKIQLVNAVAKNCSHARFFKGNPYTLNNIKRYLSEVSCGTIEVVNFESKHSSDRILLNDTTSGRTYSRSWNQIVRGAYNIPRTTEYFKHPQSKNDSDDIRSFIDGRFDVGVVSDAYVGSQRVVRFVCNKHPDIGVQSVRFGVAKISQTICWQCSIDQRLETRHANAEKRFWDELDNVKNPDIEVVGEYLAQIKKIRCKCLQCGEEFLLAARHIRQGLGHRGCNRSIGENKVAQWLTELGIKYTTEYVFDDCKMTWVPMPFDFYLPDYNTVIEVDGRQHYESVPFFGGDVGLAQVQQRDAFKTAYCNAHGISIIRIPYYDLPDAEKCIGLLSEIKCA